VTVSPDRIDKPEPRWQAVLALIAVGCIYAALPPWFIVGPVWLLPAAALTVMVTAFLTIELPTRRALRVPPAEVIRAQ